MSSLQCMYMIPKEAYDVLVTKGDNLTRETLASQSVNQLNNVEVQQGANVTINATKPPINQNDQDSKEETLEDKEKTPSEGIPKDSREVKKTNLSSAIVRQNILANEGNPHFDAKNTSDQLIESKFNQSLAKNIKLGEGLVEHTPETLIEEPAEPLPTKTPKKRGRKKANTIRNTSPPPPAQELTGEGGLFPNASSARDDDNITVPRQSSSTKLRVTRSNDEAWRSQHLVNYKE